jgi:3-methyl-2-oxobutanoate hydroxymethyltransferase
LLERLGCFALFRKIPAHLAEKVAKSISIPVIGIMQVVVLMVKYCNS